MFVASPHASRVVKQLPGWPMGTLGNAGTAAGAPKIHDNFMRSRAGLFSPAAGAFGSQEMVFGAYSFLGWDFEFWKKSFRWKAFNPQLSGGGEAEIPQVSSFQRWSPDNTDVLFWLNCSNFQLAPHPLSWPQMATWMYGRLLVGARWADDEA